MPLKITFQSVKLAPKDFPEPRMQKAWDALSRTLQGPIANRLQNAFEKRVANWSHKPEFPAKFQAQVTQLRLDVSPGGANKRYWIWVSGGVKPRVIRARRSKALRVRTGHHPKTSPGGSYGGSGAYTGSEYWTPVVSNWPGVKAREFENDIVSELEKGIITELTQEIERAMR